MRNHFIQNLAQCPVCYSVKAEYKDGSTRWHKYKTRLPSLKPERCSRKKMKPKPEHMLSQCPRCRAVETRYTDGKIRWQRSIVVFTQLEKKRCPDCNKL